MSFITTPLSDDMVTQKCNRPECIDLLCVGCGWEGHCEPEDAPWVIFQTHTCKMRVADKIGSDL